MKIRKLGAIDIGSNGVRLLIANVTEIDGKSPYLAKAVWYVYPFVWGRMFFWTETFLLRTPLAYRIR